MFIKFVDNNYFFCNSYPCVLFESLSHVIIQESPCLFVKFGENLPRSFFEVLKNVNLIKF